MVRQREKATVEASPGGFVDDERRRGRGARSNHTGRFEGERRETFNALVALEIYRGRPIFYSLGNFIFHVRSEKSTWTAPEVWESVIGLCSFGDDNGLIEITLHPVIIGGDEALADGVLEHRLAPHLAAGESAERILRRFSEQSTRFGVDVEISGGVGVIRF